VSDRASTGAAGIVDAVAVAGAALRPLPRAFFARPTERVARDLLGKLLVRRMLPGVESTRAGAAPLIVARIVEVEAYLGERDAASHARRGPTPRAAMMFGPPGHLYVYLIYGMYHCMNFVTEAEGHAGAVLIRAAALVTPDPLGGGGLGSPAAVLTRAAATALSGPGKLCRGLGITLAHKGLDLTTGADLFVANDNDDPRPPRRKASPRIGVDYAGDWVARKLRFYIPGHPSVSGQPKT
jgi:DNA-3-methyladenine glycosylase